MLTFQHNRENCNWTAKYFFLHFRLLSETILYSPVASAKHYHFLSHFCSAEWRDQQCGDTDTGVNRGVAQNGEDGTVLTDPTSSEEGHVRRVKLLTAPRAYIVVRLLRLANCKHKVVNTWYHTRTYLDIHQFRIYLRADSAA